MSAARGSRAGERLPKKERGCAPLPPYSARDSCRRIRRAYRFLTSQPLFHNPTVSPHKDPARRSGLWPSLSVPRQAFIAQTPSGQRELRLVFIFQCLEIMLRMTSNPWKILADFFRYLDDLSQGTSKHRKIVEIVPFTPQDSTTTTCSIAPTRPQTGNLPARSQEACRFAVRRYRRTSPAAFRVPFPCAVRSRSPVLHAVQPCCDALTPAALSCCLRLCAAIAVLFAVAVAHSVVICTEPHSPLQMHWSIPGGARSGKRGWCSPFNRPCRVRVRVARHSSQDDRHTPGPAETSLRNPSPSNPLPEP